MLPKGSNIQLLGGIMVTMYDMPAIKRGIFKCAYKALLSSAPQSAFCVGLFRSSAGAAKTVLLNRKLRIRCAASFCLIGILRLHLFPLRSSTLCANLPIINKCLVHYSTHTVCRTFLCHTTNSIAFNGTFPCSHVTLFRLLIIPMLRNRLAARIEAHTIHSEYMLIAEKAVLIT